MEVKKKMKEKRCLKFTGYIYLLPDEEADEKYKRGRMLRPAPGRIEIFDEQNNKTGKCMKAFSTGTEMSQFIETELKRRNKLIMKKW